jgi:excisionase family DNA binding protein
MSAVTVREPITASADDRATLRAIEALTGEKGGCAEIQLEAVGSAPIPVPLAMLQLIHDLAHHLARGRAVAVEPIDTLLTTQEAADLLNVSRPYLVQLLDRGEIPYTRKTSHRRIRFDDLIAYKRRRDAERFAGLGELTRMSEELGLYDAPMGEP